LQEAVVKTLHRTVLATFFLGSAAACSAPTTDPNANAANVTGGQPNAPSAHASAASQCASATLGATADYASVQGCYDTANANAIPLIESTLAASGSSLRGQTAARIATFQAALDALAFTLGADQPPANRTVAWVDAFFGESDAKTISDLMDGYADLGGFRIEPFEEDRAAIGFAAFPDCYRGLTLNDPAPVECVEGVILGRAAAVAQIAMAADQTLDAATAQEMADGLVHSAIDGAHSVCATLSAAVGTLPLFRADDERSCRMTAAMRVGETIAYFAGP
jgi:hypothetical protein